MQLPKQH